MEFEEGTIKSTSDTRQFSIKVRTLLRATLLPRVNAVLAQ